MAVRVLVKRDRMDKHWLFLKEGQVAVGVEDLYEDMSDAALAAHKAFPDALVYIDERNHARLKNGIVLLMGEPDYQPVEFA